MIRSIGALRRLVAFGRGVNAAAFEDTVARAVGTAETDEAAPVESGPPVPPGSVTTGLVALAEITEEVLLAPAVEVGPVERARIRLATFRRRP